MWAAEPRFRGAGRLQNTLRHRQCFVNKGNIGRRIPQQASFLSFRIIALRNLPPKFIFSVKYYYRGVKS